MTEKKFVPTEEMIAAALNVTIAMAHLQTIEPVVKGYQKRILADGQWKVREQFAPRLGDSVITDPERDYLMSDADFATYDALCKEARIRAGLHVSTAEHCPLLEAKARLLDVQNKLIDAMTVVTKITAAQILAAGLDKRSQYIELTLRLLVPLIPKEATDAASLELIS